MFYDTMKDYRDKYLDTYVIRKDGDKFTPIIVRGIDGNHHNPIFRGYALLPNGDVAIDEIKFRAKDDNILLSPIKVGMFGSNGRLAFAERMARRRWRQGFVVDNYKYKHFVRSQYDGRQVNVYDLFNTPSVALDEALHLVGNSKRGVKLNKYAGVVGSGKEGDSTLVYRNSTIGKIREGKLIIPDKYTALLDTIKRLGFDEIDVREERKPQAIGHFANKKYKMMFDAEPAQRELGRLGKVIDGYQYAAVIDYIIAKYLDHEDDVALWVSNNWRSYFFKHPEHIKNARIKNLARVARASVGAFIDIVSKMFENLAEDYVGFNEDEDLLCFSYVMDDGEEKYEINVHDFRLLYIMLDVARMHSARMNELELLRITNNVQAIIPEADLKGSFDRRHAEKLVNNVLGD